MKIVKMGIIILFVILLAQVAGCTDEDDPKKTDKSDEGGENTVIDEKDITSINSLYLKDMACNMLNGGTVTYDDDNIYFIMDNCVWSVNKEGENIKKKYDKCVENIWSENEWIYFLYQKKLYAVNKETAEEKNISDKDISSFFIVNNQIYYVSEHKLYLSDISDMNNYICIDENVYMAITDGEYIYYKCGLDIKVKFIDDMSDSFILEGYAMNPYILGEHLYVSKQYDDKMDCRINVKYSNTNSVEDYGIPSTKLVMYDDYIYSVTGKINMNTGEWAEYDGGVIENIYIVEEKLIYTIKNCDSTSEIMLYNICTEKSATLGCEKEDVYEKNDSVNQNEWKKEYYLDMAGNEFVTYDSDKIYYVFDNAIWSVDKDGTGVVMFYESIADDSRIWCDETSIYCEDLESLLIINKQTGKLTERINLGNDCIIDVFGIVDRKVYLYIANGRLYSYDLDERKYKVVSPDFASSLLVTDGKHIFYQNDNNKQLYVQNMDGSERKTLNIEVEHWVDIIGNYMYISNGRGYAYKRISLDDMLKLEECIMPTNAIEYNGYVYSEYGKICLETNKIENIDEMKIIDIDKAENKLVYILYDESDDRYMVKMRDMDNDICSILN